MPEVIGRSLTLQEKVSKAKHAVEAAGFMVDRKFRPDGERLWVRAVIAIPFNDLTMKEEALKAFVLHWIRDRCTVKENNHPMVKDRPLDLRTSAGRRWKAQHAEATA